MGKALLLDREPLYRSLAQLGMESWILALRQLCAQRYTKEFHGLYEDWEQAWNQLPGEDQCTLELGNGQVCVTTDQAILDAEKIRQALMVFHPWRKGPFQFLGWDIDTEWRSDWKWERLQKQINLQDKVVLDVGCGNGYYGWRMLADGAKFVLGCEPLQLYNFQFEVFRKYAQGSERHFVVPLMDTDLPDQLHAFDVTFSMGVLYHRTSPIDHLKKLHGTLRPKGQLILETLVVDDKEATVLVPQDRYAKMRNVWFIPSVSMLQLWLERCGFRNVQVLDVSATTTQEQRKTEWMTYESLESFLDPNDASKTFEGYPGPVRAILSAERG